MSGIQYQKYGVSVSFRDLGGSNWECELLAYPMRELESLPHKQHELFGGEGTTLVWNLLGELSASPFSAVLSCELPPMGSVGKHVQQRDPEIVVGLSGHGEAEVDEQAHSLGPGCVVYLAHGQTLSIRNLSKTDPLCYLIIKARSDQPASGSGGGGAP